MRHYTHTDSETLILQGLYTFPYLTAEQVTTLLYSPGSIQKVREYLKRLHDNEEVYRKPMFTQLQKGSSPFVYWLAAKGRNRLKKIGYDFTNWRQPADMEAFIKSSHFAHSMVATDVLIAATLVPSHNSAIELVSLMHDMTLKRIRNAAVIPDGLIHFLLPDGTNCYLIIEVDLDTEKRVRFQEKIAHWMIYITSGDFARDYGIVDTPTLVFYTPTREHRVGEMLTFIEEALYQSHERQKAAWFRVGFGAILPEMFVEERWYQPHDGSNQRKSMSLLPL